MPPRRQSPLTTEQERDLERGHLVTYEPGVLTRSVAPRRWDPAKREQSAVSDEALRIWARREGFDPDRVVAWESEWFQGGRRSAPPPGLVYADPEATARGTHKTPLDLRQKAQRRQRGW